MMDKHIDAERRLGTRLYKEAAIYRDRQDKLKAEQRIQRMVDRDVDVQITKALREILSNARGNNHAT